MYSSIAESDLEILNNVYANVVGEDNKLVLLAYKEALKHNATDWEQTIDRLSDMIRAVELPGRLLFGREVVYDFGIVLKTAKSLLSIIDDRLVTAN